MWIVVSISSPDPDENCAFGPFGSVEEARAWMEAQPDETFEGAESVEVWALNEVER